VVDVNEFPEDWFTQFIMKALMWNDVKAHVLIFANFQDRTVGVRVAAGRVMSAKVGKK
jgi:hypothetical protein